MAYGNQDQGDRGSRSEPVFALQERLSLRLASHGAEAQARLPSRLKGDGGSVRASLARKLVHAKLFGRGSGAAAGGSVGGGSAARNGGVGSISVRASQRVVVKAFVARHKGPRAVANPGKAIVQHVKYLAREGVGFEGLEPNGGMEALVALPDGRYLASAEYGRDKPQDKLSAPYWIFGPEPAGGVAPFGAFTNQEDFGITDARVLGTDLWLLKRAYDPKTKINRSRLERCPLTDVLAAKPICTLELALSPPFPMDNYEGLEMLEDPKSGDWIAILLSDDNFSDDQSTNLLAIRLKASPPATPK